MYKHSPPPREHAHVTTIQIWNFTQGEICQLYNVPEKTRKQRYKWGTPSETQVRRNEEKQQQEYAGGQFSYDSKRHSTVPPGHW